MNSRIFLSTFLFLFLAVACLHAAPPSGLLTDLLEHTDRVWLDGYPSTATLAERGTLIERYQTATIYSEKPAFSWIVNDERPDVLQTAYRILVGSDPAKLDKDDADLWDSGKVDGDSSIAVRYAGKPLPTDAVIYWKVKTWNNGDEQPFSAVKSFLTADKLVDYQTAVYPLQKTEQRPILVERREGYVFIDFGKAAFGRLRLTITSDDARIVTVHFGEALKDNRIDRKPGGTIRYSEYGIPLMKGTHTYSIKFRPDKRNTGPAAVKMPDYIGEVFPFRYVEIENSPGHFVLSDEELRKFREQLSERLKDKSEFRGAFTANVNEVVREMVHYPFDVTASKFKSSNDILNQVWELCKYSIPATSFCGKYVDGDRERIPYEADALINQLCHYGVDREFSLARHSHEYLIEHATWPTEWILQSVLMAYYDYLYTGDIRSVEKFYKDLEAKLLLPLADPDTGLISTKTGKQTPELLKSIHFNGTELRDIVDWPHTGILGLGKAEGGEADGFVFSDYNPVVNAYHYESLVAMSQLAEILNKKDDAEKFAKQAAKVEKSFNEKFFDSSKDRYVDGIGAEHSSLHANMFPLAFGMVPRERKKSVMEFVKSRGMACSVYGSQFLMDAIYNAGDAEYGLKLLSSDAERSWYNMIRVGSTISLEAWDNKYKPNQDWNHAWGAAPANIVPRKMLGVEPLEPGFRTVRIKPQPGGLETVDATVPTIRGPIRIRWENRGRNLTVNLPANMKAEVVLPSDKTTRLGSGEHRIVLEP